MKCFRLSSDLLDCWCWPSVATASVAAAAANYKMAWWGEWSLEWRVENVWKVRFLRRVFCASRRARRAKSTRIACHVSSFVPRIMFNCVLVRSYVDKVVYGQ